MWVADNDHTAIRSHKLSCKTALPDRPLVEETSLLKAVPAVCIYSWTQEAKFNPFDVPGWVHCSLHIG